MQKIYRDIQWIEALFLGLSILRPVGLFTAELKDSESETYRTTKFTCGKDTNSVVTGF